MKNQLDPTRHDGRVLILADMHLRPLDSPNPAAAARAVADNERLGRFLAEAAEGASTLILLGDTFNFWFERRSRVVGDFYAALNLFKLASEKGLFIHHVCGNRDYAVGEGLGLDPTTRFPGFLGLKKGFTVSRLADFGIEPHGQRFRLHQAGKTVTFVHGDALCGQQRGFMFLRWILQGPIGKTGMRWLPWSFLETASVQLQGKMKKRRRRVDPDAVFSEQTIKREIAMGGDLLVCGHIHDYYEREVEVAGRRGRMYAVPAWMDGYYGILEDGQLRVEQF